MTKQIAIIDPFVKSPAINCFNNLVSHLNIPCTYHQPSLFGIETLLKNRNSTSAYIVLGSASHVSEHLSWHGPLKDFLIKEIISSKPTVGCCFGHQIICHGFGADVEFLHTNEDKEMGKRKIVINQDALGLSKNEEFHLAVTHRQVVKNLPDSLISIGEGLQNDIVIHRKYPFLGTQAHPEASHHFCTHDISNLNESDILQVRNSGIELIQRFFKHFNVV